MKYGIAEEISLIMDKHDVSCPLETKNVIKEINALYEDKLILFTMTLLSVSEDKAKEQVMGYLASKSA